jgi:hypothetical protein
MGKTIFIKKKLQLGMHPSTAAHKLRKMIMFELVKQVGLGRCYRCKEKIENVEDLSVEHILPWLDSVNPRKLYFDLSNITFSHLKCNVASHRYNTSSEKLSKASEKRWEGKRLGCGTTAAYQRGCRCEKCKKANAEYQADRRVRLNKR